MRFSEGETNDEAARRLNNHVKLCGRYDSRSFRRSTLVIPSKRENARISFDRRTNLKNLPETTDLVKTMNITEAGRAFIQLREGHT
jgi:hypothetical protein